MLKSASDTPLRRFIGEGLGGFTDLEPDDCFPGGLSDLVGGGQVKGNER